MKDLAMLKFPTAIYLALTISLTACKGPGAQRAETPKSKSTATESIKNLPPLKDYISCLPQDTALLAAHRGTGAEHLAHRHPSSFGTCAQNTRRHWHSPVSG